MQPQQEVSKTGSGESEHPPEQAPRATTARQFRELVRELGRESEALLRGEAALLKAEMNAKAHQLESGIRTQALGASALLAGLLMLLFGAAFGLSEIMPLWLASLIVGAAVTLLAVGLLIAASRKTKYKNLMPSRSFHEAREVASFAREHVR